MVYNVVEIVVLLISTGTAKCTGTEHTCYKKLPNSRLKTV